VAVGASDLLAYSRTRVAPSGRMEAIEQVGDHLRGEGPVLWNEFEEYAKYFARAARVSVPFETLTPLQVQLRRPVGSSFYGRWFDLDEELLGFVERYPLIVTRHSPGASRPPANYTLVYSNHYYEAWRRSPRPRVLAHLPEQREYSASATVQCPAVQKLVARAPSGAELVVARAPEVDLYEPLYSADRSEGWGEDTPQPGAVVTNTPGHASGVLAAPASGRYEVWVQGDFPRAVEVVLDGRRVGSVSGSNTPRQWLRVASIELAAGSHPATIIRAAGRDHLGPGEWSSGVIGAVAIRAPRAETLQTVPLRDWRRLCGTSADWVELVQA